MLVHCVFVCVRDCRFARTHTGMLLRSFIRYSCVCMCVYLCCSSAIRQRTRAIHAQLTVYMCIHVSNLLSDEDGRGDACYVCSGKEKLEGEEEGIWNIYSVAVDAKLFDVANAAVHMGRCAFICK